VDNFLHLCENRLTRGIGEGKKAPGEAGISSMGRSAFAKRFSRLLRTITTQRPC